MKILMMIALILFLSLGCGTKGKFGSQTRVDPIQDSEDQPVDAKQDEDLSALGNESGLEKSLDGDLNPVFFEYDRFDITQAQIPVLQSNARVVKEQGLPRIRIEGHCDERGTEEYNLALGDRRARAAKEYLVTLGIDSVRIQTISFGESRPFQSGQDEDAWSLNRRAHFVVE